MSAIDTVLDALTVKGCDPRRSGDGWSAKCPAHDDSNPSLSVNVKPNGDVLLNCHASCSTREIMAELELPMRALFEQSRNGSTDDNWTPAGPAIAWYSYTDAKGKVICGVAKTADKQFRQWRPDPTKRHGRAWSVKGVTMVPYRLPEVLEAGQNGQTVYVVEGEKDAESMRGHGFTATTNIQGAGKWRKSYNRFFQGAEVVVIADRDKAGYDHAHDVVANLTGVAGSVRLVEAKEGKDATDHLEAGYGVEDFVELDVEACCPTR